MFKTWEHSSCWLCIHQSAKLQGRDAIILQEERA